MLIRNNNQKLYLQSFNYYGFKLYLGCIFRYRFYRSAN